MRHFRTAAALIALSACLSANGADYRLEYDKKVKATQDVGVLGMDAAGEQINHYTGSVSFAVTDFSAKGNGMGISLSRSYDVELEHQIATAKGVPGDPEIFLTRQRLFGDWDLDIPHISTVMTYDGGWAIDSKSPTQRCSVIGQERSASTQPATGEPASVIVGGAMGFAAADYWSGYTLHAGGSQSLLLASLTNNERPSTGGPYHWTTNKDWWISCLSSVTGGTGEGFFAISPDGSKYWFDRLSKRRVNTVSKQGEVDPEGYGWRKVFRLFRAEYQMLPSRIEDRFGNWTTYSWSSDEFARLTSVSSGQVGSSTAERTITFQYNSSGYITWATDGRTNANNQVVGWTYEYDGSSLWRVTQPDGASWLYDLYDLSELMAPLPYCEWETGTTQWYLNCFGSEVSTGPGMYASITHPSGVKSEYMFGQRFHYTPNGSNYSLGIYSKTMSGPGLVTGTWKYDQAYETLYICPSSPCPTRVLADELAPDGSIHRRIFGIMANQQDETMLLGELFGSTVASSGGGSAAITASPVWPSAVLTKLSPTTNQAPTWYREQDYYYVPDSLAPYTVRVGANPLATPYGTYNTAGYSSERRLPVAKTVLTQQGVTFTSEVPVACASKRCYDAYANPIRRVMSSVGGNGGNFSRTETYAYQSDTAKWVVGLPVSTTCTGNSDCTPDKVVTLTQYDATTLLPWKTYSFGALTATLTYNSNGTLATATDARGYTVSLGTWQLGTPTSINFPTLTPGVTVPISASLTPTGWIGSTNDELNSKTCYEYDVMARLSKITYPSEASANTCDASTWTALNRSFVPVASAEYGIPAGHWRQVVYTGTGKTTTYYDALWHPVVVLTEDTANASTKSFVVSRFDNMGRVTFKSYPVSSLSSVNDNLLGVRTTYDGLGRVTRVQQDSESVGSTSLLNTDTSYISGFRTQVTNPRGFTTTTSYQVFDQPSADAPVLIQLPEGVTTTITRQPSLGKPTEVARSGLYGGVVLGAVRSYVYDAQERLCETSEPEPGATVIDYDANGNVAWSADGRPSTLYVSPGTAPATVCSNARAAVPAASKISRTYDAMNRELTRTTTAGNENITTTYYPDGQVNTVTAANPGNNPVITTYTYNKRRMLTREVLQITPSVAWTFDYAYNGNGHLSSQTYPGNLVVGYAPDGLGRPT